MFITKLSILSPHIPQIISYCSPLLKKRITMKIIQLFMILALITSIVSEDKYVVAKLPPGALVKGAQDAKGDDYWARPWPWAAPSFGGRTRPPTTPKMYDPLCNLLPFSTIHRDDCMK